MAPGNVPFGFVVTTITPLHQEAQVAIPLPALYTTYIHIHMLLHGHLKNVGTPWSHTTLTTKVLL